MASTKDCVSWVILTFIVYLIKVFAEEPSDLVVKKTECATDLLWSDETRYFPMFKDGLEYGYNYIHLKEDKNQEIWKDFGEINKANVSC